MNIASKKFFFLFASAALLFAGCTKKPQRPDPSATVLGQQPGGGGSQLMTQDIGLTADPFSGLESRGPGVIEDENTIRGLLQPVYFDFDQSAIKPSERPKLQEAARYLSEHPEHRILLEGHADWRGTAEYNLGLGDRRANSAKRYLGTLTSADKIETVSKGSLEATQNGDDATMANDRRVEIVILKN